jgi:hypothetical protein
MGVSLKTEQRRSHIAVSSFRPWVRRAEGYRGTSYLQSCRQVPVKPRRPPSLPLICIVFPAISSFSVFRETPMASAIHFKELNCYLDHRSEGFSGEAGSACKPADRMPSTNPLTPCGPLNKVSAGFEKPRKPGAAMGPLTPMGRC